MFSKILIATLCALTLSLPVASVAAADQAPVAADSAKAPSPTAALLTDLADEVASMVGDTSAGVHLMAAAGDTRLERAIQEGLVTALFDKGVSIYDAPAPGVVVLRVAALGAAVEGEGEERKNLLSRGVSVVRNVLVSDPRVSLVTKPFSRGDARKAPDATLFVTLSVVRSTRMTARRTNAYTLPGSELMAQLALQ